MDLSNRATLYLVIGLMSASSAVSQELCPKYGECVPESRFECHDVDRSSLVTRVCYDATEKYMIIRLKSTYYHYCRIDPATVAALLNADSMGSFYRDNIKDNATGGKFSCRT